MLKLTIEGDELWDEETNEFSSLDGITIDLEHSLISVSKWESEYNKPFLSSKLETYDEVLGYIRAMLLTPDIDLDVLNKLSQSNFDAIQSYIDSPQSATTFGNMPERRGPGETITSELIYYWMIAFNIPFECERWHLNRLFSLIRICNIKNSKPKKMSRHELAQRNRELNRKRREELGTSG